jgi:hypothetical protein
MCWTCSRTLDTTTPFLAILVVMNLWRALTEYFDVVNKGAHLKVRRAYESGDTDDADRAVLGVTGQIELDKPASAALVLNGDPEIPGR